MIYHFPRIESLSDVIPHIEGQPEFILVQKEGYQVVNYVLSTNETFPDLYYLHAAPGRVSVPNWNLAAAVRRECRGLVFDLSGTTIGRRYHKFFNMGERQETLPEAFNFNQAHVIMEKLDGSMVSPVKLESGIRWMTKMGITDTSMNAEEYVAINPLYQKFAEYAIGRGWTPIFEWCSRKNRIVVDYPTDSLFLTGVRGIVSGAYMLYPDMVKLARQFAIDCTPAWGEDDARGYLMELSKVEDFEGVVVRFDTGYMVKVKTAWYVMRHRSKDAVTRERNVISYIVNQELDDVKPFLVAEDAQRLEEFAQKFDHAVGNVARALQVSYDGIMDRFCGDRKRFALEEAPRLGKNTARIFRMMDGQSPMEIILNEIRKNCGSQSKIDSVRELFQGLQWTNGGDIDA